VSYISVTLEISPPPKSMFYFNHAEPLSREEYSRFKYSNDLDAPSQFDIML
jgi:hypothetical protein